MAEKRAGPEEPGHPPRDLGGVAREGQPGPQERVQARQDPGMPVSSSGGPLPALHTSLGRSRLLRGRCPRCGERPDSSVHSPTSWRARRWDASMLAKTTCSPRAMSEADSWREGAARGGEGGASQASRLWVGRVECEEAIIQCARAAHQRAPRGGPRAWGRRRRPRRRKSPSGRRRTPQGSSWSVSAFTTVPHWSPIKRPGERSAPHRRPRGAHKVARLTCLGPVRNATTPETECRCIRHTIAIEKSAT